MEEEREELKEGGEMEGRREQRRRRMRRRGTLRTQTGHVMLSHK